VVGHTKFRHGSQKMRDREGMGVLHNGDVGRQ
jgi:hypothetical protein